MPELHFNMHFEKNEIYHIYNRGNLKQKLFLYENHYSYFLRKIEKYICPRCDLLAWCLMPNHFHFLCCANSLSVQMCNGRILPIQYLSDGIRLLLSSYTQGINNQSGRSGNIFQQKTKAKLINEKFTQAFPGKDSLSYASTVFHYIHQNPVKAGLVLKMEDWTYSSFQEYAGLAETNYCNKNLTK